MRLRDFGREKSAQRLCGNVLDWNPLEGVEYTVSDREKTFLPDLRDDAANRTWVLYFLARLNQFKLFQVNVLSLFHLEIVSRIRVSFFLLLCCCPINFLFFD